MTFPITPLPSIHNDPFDAALEAQQAEALLQSMAGILEQFAFQIVEGIINAILRGLGLGAFTGRIDQGLAELQAQINGLLTNPVGTAQADLNALISGVGGATIADVVTQLQHIQQIIDNLANGLGIVGSNNPVSTILTTIENIPNTNVVGQIAATIGADISGTVSVLSHLFGQFLGVPTPTTYSAMQNYVGPTALQLDSAVTLSNAAGVALAAQAISNPSSWGIDPTASPVFHLTNLTGASATTVGVTASATGMGFVGTPNATIKKSIAFLGYYTGGLTSVVLNLYSVNTSNGQLTFVLSSGNIIGQLSTGSVPVWTYYNFTPAQVFQTPTIGSLAGTQAVQTDWYAIEMAVVGTGTFNLVGMPNHWLPANANVFPSQLAASRTTPVTTPPAYGATGPGLLLASGNGSYTHTLKATDSAIIVWMAFNYVSGAGPSVTCGGTSMTILASYNYGGTNYLQAFGLTSPPTGAQTIAITGGACTSMAINSVSYGGVVGGFGTPVLTNGTSAAPAQTVGSGATSQLVAQAFANGSTSSGTFSGYSQNARSTQQFGASNYGLLIGDAPGAASVSFSATLSASETWGAVGIQLSGSLTGPPVSPFAPTYSGNVPWFALCGSAGVSDHAPLTQSFLTAGSFIYTPPAWAQQVLSAGGTVYFDLVALGGAGSGQFSGSGLGFGGAAGAWNTSRLTYVPGNTIPATLSVTVGAGGPSVGLSPSLGVAGGNSSVSGTGITTLTASGGAGGGNPYTGSGFNGGSPGNSSGPTGSPLGLTYTGGSGGVAATTGSGQTGTAPGGAGSGGGNTFPISGPGAGAQGAVFITCYQGAIGTAPSFVAPQYYVLQQKQIPVAIPRGVTR